MQKSIHDAELKEKLDLEQAGLCYH